MNPNLFHSLPAWGVPLLLPVLLVLLVLAAHLAGGIGLGALYFHALWRNTRQFADGTGIAVVIGWMVGRFALLAAVLVPVSFEGALPLLATALGIFVARFFVARRVRRLEAAA